MILKLTGYSFWARLVKWVFLRKDRSIVMRQPLLKVRDFFGHKPLLLKTLLKTNIIWWGGGELEKDLLVCHQTSQFPIAF